MMGSSFRIAALAIVMWPGLAAAADTGQAPAAAASGQWQGVFNTEVRYLSWNSSGGNSGIVGMGGGSGQQIYVPAALQLTGRPTQDVKLEFLVRSGEIWTRQRTPGGTVEISSPTDTTVSVSGSYFGWAGIQPFLSLNVNIPTGGTIINGTSSNTKTDADLVPTPVFGEGWNFGTTFGVNLPINESLIASLGAGYTNRGTYDRAGIFDPITTTQGTVHYDPGDVFTVNSSIGYRGDRGSVQLSASYSVETATLLDDLQYFRAGDRVILSAKAGYAWSDTWSSRLIGQYSHTAKDQIAQAGASGLVLERANSNGDVYRVSIDTTYGKESFSIGPTAGLLFRAANGYESTAPEFVPQRTGWLAGVVASYAASPQLSFNARAERLWVKEDDNPTDVNALNLPIPGTEIPAIMTNGWLGSISGVIRF